MLEKTLESPLDYKEIQPVHPKGDQCSLEGLMLKLKFQCFGHLMRRADSLENTLMLGKIGGRRRIGWQSTRRLDNITDSMNMNLSKLWETVEDREPWRAAVHAVAESHSFLTEQQQSCLYDLSGKSSLLTKALLISKKAPRWLAR